MTLRTRLALTFFLTALVTGAAVAWFGVVIASRYLEEVDRELTSRIGESAPLVQAEREEAAVQAVRGIADLVRGNRIGTDAPDIDLALQTARLSGLDILQVLDGEGTIRGSLHWPEQVLSRSTLLTDRVMGTGQVVAVPGPASSRDAFVVQAPVPYEGRTWILVGGVYQDGEAAPTALSSYDRVDPGVVRPMLAAGLGCALFAGLVGILLARILTRPLDEMTRALDDVAAGDENHDYPQPRGDEFGPMVASFSRMRSNLDREQARLKAVERVAAWRETARRVAHEIKNPLVPIRLTMENLIKARGMGAEQFDPIFEDGARAVLEEVGRLGRIVDAFSAYARMPAPDMQSADLERILDPVLALFAGEGNVRILREPGPGELPVSGDPDQLAQAFRNILSNCREAIGDAGGEIRIRTTVEGGHAVVEITDTGPGLGDEVIEKLFDPYYTTRKEGTGLGMAITHRIVTEHGGAVTAGNQPGGGARFTVSIPLAGAED